MKLRVRGYSPRLEGRPDSSVLDIPLPSFIEIGCTQSGTQYSPVVKNGQKVTVGESLAEAKESGGSLFLPSPAAGKIILESAGEQIIKIETSSGDF